jgi:hypothetical protein
MMIDLLPTPDLPGVLSVAVTSLPQVGKARAHHQVMNARTQGHWKRSTLRTHLTPPLLVHLLKLSKVALVLVQLVVVQVDNVSGHTIQEVPASKRHAALHAYVRMACAGFARFPN